LVNIKINKSCLLKNKVAQLDEAFCYKPEGRGLNSQWVYWDFLFT